MAVTVTGRLFAVECYDATGSGYVALPPLPGTVRLVVAVRLPADEVVLALVEGPDAETVTDVITQADWRPDRIEPAVLLYPTDDRAARAREGERPS
jgi:hypothetical protein